MPKGMKAVNICQLTDTFLPIVDGVGRVVLAYAETLSGMGHQVTVCCPMYNTGHRGGLPFELVDYAGFKVPTAPQYKVGTAALDSHYKKRMDMIDLDVVHSHSPFSAGKEALRLARDRKLPLVASFHSKYYDDFLNVTHSEAIAKVVVSNIVNFYMRCDEVWAVSERSGEVLRAYGYKGRILVMPNGVTMRTADPQKIRDVEERFSLSSHPLLLFVGQINWKKNILRVLEAASLLMRSGVTFRLLLAGQGPDEKMVQEKIMELGLSECASLTGHIADMETLDALYARAAVFTFPSLYDNAPMVVREAAVMGTPAVLVSGSSAAEIIHDGANGFLCRDDSKDLFRVLNQALMDLEKTRYIGMQARTTIPLPWRDIMDKALARYEELVREKKGRKRKYYAQKPAMKALRG